MFLLLLRTFVIYLLIILAMRLMGKKQLGELKQRFSFLAENDDKIK